MRTLSSDTSVKAEQVHIELIRKASVYRRLEMVNSLVKIKGTVVQEVLGNQ